MPEFEHRRLAARWIGWTPVRIWGMVPVERLRRSLIRAGVWDSGPWTGQVPVEPGAVLLLLGDHVYDDALVAALIHAPATILTRGDGRIVAANVPRHRAEDFARALVAGTDPPDDLPRRRGADLVAPEVLNLRNRPVPLVMPVSPELRTAVEDRLFDAAGPKVTDLIGKVVWPVPALLAARACVRLGLSPNGLTVLNLLLAILAAVLFYSGWLWSGLACAWSVAFLDYVNAMLTRVTLGASQLGGGFGQIIGLIHPLLWWWAWWVGCGGTDVGALGTVLAGTLAIRAEEGLFRWRFGLDLHLWSRFDSLFRLITARRNIILLILSAALTAGHPLWGISMAGIWLLASLLVHGSRILQAGRLVQMGKRPISWLIQ